MSKTLKRLVLLLLVVALLGLIGCETIFDDDDNGDDEGDNGGNDGSGMTSSVTVNFPQDMPDFFAYRIGATGSWIQEAVSGSFFSFDVDDNDSAFAIAGTCLYRGWRMGYIYESDTNDAQDFTVKCDRTDARVSYEFTGDATSFGTGVPFTLGLKNRLAFGFGLNYSVTVDLDADEDDEQDVIVWAVLGIGQNHYKLQRRLTLTPTNQWDVDFDPGDTGEDVEVDVGNFAFDPDYQDTRFRLHTLGGLRAEIGFDDTPNQSQHTFQKLPGSLAASGDMYEAKTSIEGMVTKRAQVRYASNPTSVDLSAMPNDLPSVNGVEGGAADDFVWKLQLSASYDIGISGFDVNYASTRTEGVVASENNLPIRWWVYKTSSRLDIDPSLSVPKGLSAFSDWNDDWTPGKADITGAGVVGSNGSDQQALDAQVNDAPVDDLGVAIAVRFQILF
jgi:hypothetical protein